MIDYKSLLISSLIAVIKAADEIMRYYKSGFSIDIKHDGSPVTNADIASHKIIVKDLNSNDIPIISEEGYIPDFEVRKNWKRFWLLDPLDGTQGFIKKNDAFCISLALIEDKIPILGILYAPALKQLYWGCLDLGAFRLNELNINMFDNLESLQAKSIKMPKKPRKGVYTYLSSRSKYDIASQKYIEQLRQKNTPSKVIHLGSAIKIGLLLEGYAQEYTRITYLKEWDLAAVHALCLASGLEFKPLNPDNPIIYNTKKLETQSFTVKNL